MRRLRTALVSVILAAAAVAGITAWGGSSSASNTKPVVVADLGWNSAVTGH
jgi:hypothetical protein